MDTKALATTRKKPCPYKMGKLYVTPRLLNSIKCISGFSRSLDLNDFTLATITTRKVPSFSSVDINTFHASHGQAHEQLLHSTTKQRVVVLEGNLRDCKGCSAANGLGKSIGRKTLTGRDNVFVRLFVDSCGEKSTVLSWSQAG